MVEVVELLLLATKKKPQKRRLFPFSNTPLHWAALFGHLRVVWLLLEAGYATNDADEVGNEPLHLAATGGHASVVRVLLADGADTTKKNAYSNTPLTLAKSPETRRLLEDYRVSGRRANLDAYRSAGESLQRAMGRLEVETPETLVAQSDRLSSALSHARALGIKKELVERGESALSRLATHVELREMIATVKGAAPIVTQRAYCDLVNKLKRLRREAAVAGENDCGAPSRLLEEADELAARSTAEYWLETHGRPLKTLECADEAAKAPMARLSAAIQRADVCRADVSLVQTSRALLARRAAELDLREALAALPVPNAEEEVEEKEGCCKGHILETPEYPLPPDGGSYKWIPSASLSALRQAAERLAQALTKARQTEAFPALVSAADKKKNLVADDLRQLERKDLEDRELAIAGAEKAAKKLKKKKKK
ncbi:hypothetical protein CTAYLR_005780 [Chrysophaeum taylorii]|uniref:Uncharacterized protein n=1 Tax=Chrysophaeum taylorii TaxID=2483200 RepID=A0AAD7UN06_9STRA|nr:hypothetical protein CTAYLR_005780 [Chrysophaeum taylorii]